MTDLQGKFAALETALTAKLDIVIARLDSLISAVTTGGSIDAAPIVAAIEALRGVGPENTLKSVNQSLWNIAGPAPGRTLTELYNILTYQEGQVLWTSAGLMHAVYLSLMNSDRTADVADLLTYLNAATGAAPNNSLELSTVRGLLNALLSASGQTGILPDNPEGAIDSSVTQTLNGRRYVVWNSPIAGVTRSEDHITLTPESTWSGYSIYVQSAAPTFQSGSGGEWPTNSWSEMPLSGNVQISVEAQYTVRAFIRVPIVESFSFDLLPNGTYRPYNYGTGPWPTSTLWTQPAEYSNPDIGPTATTSITLRFTPFNGQGATVVQYFIAGVLTQASISAPTTLSVAANQMIVAAGGNGQISFHVEVNP